MSINEWIDTKLADIANELPRLVYNAPHSFACGYNTGYKTALLDLENMLDKIIEDSFDEPIDFRRYYKSKWEIDGLS